MLSLIQTRAPRHVRCDGTQLAVEWLLDSGICRPGFGVAAEYRTDGKEYAPVSKKATAYYVSALIWLFEAHGETRYIDRALTTAQYLSRSARNFNVYSFPSGMTTYHRSVGTRLDECGVILRALLRSWHASQHSEFLSKAIECANAMQGISGSCPLESAQGWLDLAEVTGNAQWREFYDRALAWSLTGYSEFFESEDSKPAAFPTKFTHFPPTTTLIGHCCFLEALLPILVRPANRSGEALRVFQRVFAFVSNGLRSSSIMTLSGNTVRAEACARLLRLRLYAAALGLIKLDANQAEREAGLIRQMQADHYDPRIGGGFYTGRHSSAFEPVVGLVPTAISLQALAQWQQFKNGDFRPDYLQLV